MIDPLTPRQLEVMAFIFRRECAGSIATWREIMVAIGVRSTNAVACLVRLLERKGYLAPVHGLKRAIRVTALPVFSGEPGRVVDFIPLGAA